MVLLSNKTWPVFYVIIWITTGVTSVWTFSVTKLFHWLLKLTEKHKNMTIYYLQNWQTVREQQKSDLKCRIWTCNKKFNFSLDIRVSVNLAFFEKIGLFLALFEHSCKLSNFLKKYQIHANSDVQGRIDFFITNKDSILQVCMKFAFIVTCSVFLVS